MARLGNPLGFTPLPVIVITCITYIALFAALLTVHLTVPNVPSSTPQGINLTQAWGDLQAITGKFHPFNSRANDNVRDYLLSRVKGILAEKEMNLIGVNGEKAPREMLWTTKDEKHVMIIDDLISNVTFSGGGTDAGQSVYFEGTNIIVAIRGSEDDAPAWTNASGALRKMQEGAKGGVLVNAHYDSVSTGFGATDDGVGIVTILQLLSYFTESDKNWPKRTVVLLLNNGEEDFLNGAKAFMRHPISQVPHTFLNLEGAGAGGRATLFRSTDTEVTKFYQASKYPFGTVLSSDGFKKRLIRSETDYVVFHGELGLRGLDVAFMEPRARYHTVEDSARETSMNSLWHMLSAAISTVSGLADDTSSDFSSSGQARNDGKVDAGHGSQSVWFDLFGRAFVVFQLHTLFALCVTLAVVGPISLIAVTVGLSKANKFYPFSRKQYVHSSDDDQAVYLNGWRGLFRYPVAFVVATAAVVGLAYLVVRVNPLIAYSSPFAVWSMSLSAWFILAWFVLRGASAMRPTALQRFYSLLWMYMGSFILLVAVTVGARNYDISGGYFLFFYAVASYLALLISYVELFFVPKKSAYVEHFATDEGEQSPSRPASRPLTGTTGGNSEERPLLDDDATETTSLLRGDRRSFRRYGSRRESLDRTNTDDGHPSSDLGQAYEGEQEWSGKLPGWFWFIQFLLLVPFNVILIGQIGLLTTSALNQTSADGSPALTLYLAIAILTTLLLAPAGPFLHRFTYHIPTFLLFVCVGTLIYNLVAFPFSRDYRLKVYFLQHVECDTGINTVSLTGQDDYVQRIISEIPSSRGQNINCTTPGTKVRKELKSCAWKGLPARPVPKTIGLYSNRTYEDIWFDFSAKRLNGTNTARFHIQPRNTRSCRILFDTPVTDFDVRGAAHDKRFDATGEKGSVDLRLWHREWSKHWDVTVKWEGDVDEKKKGKVVCLWSDANDRGAIPAFEEVLHYMPVWSIATKMGDGLLEGSKQFTL